MITVDHISQELDKADIPLIAGIKGRDREIRYVTTIELKERTSRIQEKGLLLSTFHAFKDTDEILEHLEWLVEIGVSAIGFHTSVYPDIPDQVKKFADEQGLPLFQIPAETPYNLIFELFNDMRQEIREQARARIGRLNQLLIESILSGRGLRVIIDMIGEYSGGDMVAWLDSDLNVLEQWTGTGIERGTVCLLMGKIQSEKQQLQEARIRNEPYRLHGSSVEGRLIVFPVFSETGFGGYLVFHFIRGQDAPEDSLMGEMIRTASKILMSDVYNPDKQGRTEIIRILEQLLLGDADPRLVLELPISQEREFQILLIEPVNQEEIGLLGRVNRWVEMHAEQSSEQISLFPPLLHQHRLIILVKSDVDINQWIKLLPKNSQLVVGVSDSADMQDGSSYRRLYTQAAITLKLCRQNGRKLSEWNQTGIEKVAVFLEDQELFQGFAEQLLHPLVEYDRMKNTELVRTLQVYLDHFFNLKKTGEALFVHPNTVKYRLETIRELLPVDLEDAAVYAMLVLAYRSYDNKS